MLYRHAAVKVAEGEARAKVREVGGNNRGPKVARYLAAAGLREGYPWCMAFVVWCFRQAGLPMMYPGLASVGYFEQWARREGDIVKRPLRGDCGCWRIDADSWPDHVFFVRRVLRLGPVLVMSTVEGNTSSGEAGSQDDGGGVFFRRRVIRADRLVFVRVPGSQPVKPKTKGANAKRLDVLRAWIVKRHRHGWSWVRLKKTANWREYKRRGGK